MMFDGFWIGVCPCGAVRAALVGGASKEELTQFGAELVGDGYEVRRMLGPVTFSRHADNCNHKRRQISLDSRLRGNDKTEEQER